MNRTTAALLGAAVVALGAVGSARPAGAHDLPPGVHNVVDRLDPPHAGVTVQVVRSVTDQMVVENRTPHDLEVLAPTGEPFLRIGPAGAFANVNSPSWFLSSSVEGTAAVPAHAHAGAPVDFRKLSAQPSWGWFDHRLHPGTIPAPRGARSQRLLSWTIPMRIGGDPLSVRGHVQFDRPLGSVEARVTQPRLAPGVSVVATPGGTIPALVASVTGDASVVVFGAAGEPLLRAGPSGTDANVASPTWLVTAAAQDQAPDGPVDASSPPRWVHIATNGRFHWLEPRARFPRATPPAGVTSAHRRQVVGHWRIPVTVNGTPRTIQGENVWVPVAGIGVRHRNRTPLVLVLVAIGVAIGAMVGVVGTRRRRARHASEAAPA